MSRGAVPPGEERALRVLHLRNADLLGGPERLLLDQVERARGRDDARLTLVSFGREGAPHPLLDEARRRGLDARLVAQRGSYDPRLGRRVRALLHEVAPDVVVGHDYKANLLLRRAARLHGVPWVAVVHGYTAENLKVRLFERWDRRALRHAAAVVVVSEAGALTARAAGVAPERVHLVPNGIDADAVRRAAAAGRATLRARLGASPDERLVLALGRLSPEKGQRTLLQAWARLAPPHARLVLVGEGADRPALEALAAGAPAVTFAGWRGDPHACLGAADLLVLPSLREGLPLALLEAMAVGLPIVASAVGGVPDALDGGRAGVLVPPGDAAALAAALARLLDDPGRAATLGAAARDRVLERYGAAAQAERLLAVYRAATGSCSSEKRSAAGTRGLL